MYQHICYEGLHNILGNFHENEKLFAAPVCSTSKLGTMANEDTFRIVKERVLVECQPVVSS
jgi:hypothetical protein